MFDQSSIFRESNMMDDMEVKKILSDSFEFESRIDEFKDVQVQTPTKYPQTNRSHVQN
jgi:hypothetical protein